MSGAFLLLSPHIIGRNILKKNNNQDYFNIIFKDNNQILPEIDDTELLTFGLTFMKIRARELNYNNYNNVKDY